MALFMKYKEEEKLPKENFYMTVQKWGKLEKVIDSKRMNG